jgi:hypothetical protein
MLKSSRVFLVVCGRLRSSAEPEALVIVFPVLDARSTHGWDSPEPLSLKFEVHFCSFCGRVECGVGGASGKQVQKVQPRLPFLSYMQS